MDEFHDTTDESTTKYDRDLPAADLDPVDAFGCSALGCHADEELLAIVADFYEVRV